MSGIIDIKSALNGNNTFNTVLQTVAKNVLGNSNATKAAHALAIGILIFGYQGTFIISIVTNQGITFTSTQADYIAAITAEWNNEAAALLARIV